MAEEPKEDNKLESHDDLVMQFDPNTIEHLGIQMYSTLPPVVAELVSNSYDAEAEYVSIELYDEKEKSIIITDTGHGMTFDEINTHFLMIGRNRRESENKEKSKNDRRYVIGKKGIGKLAFFGIAEIIEIETVTGGLKNRFLLDWQKIKGWKAKKDKPLEDHNKLYKPEILEKNISTDSQNGTKITLKKINRKNAFTPEGLAISLARSFQVFDQEDFKVEIFHNSREIKTELTNELRYSTINIEYTREFPLSEDMQPFKYSFSDLIEGKLLAAQDTVTSSMRGVALFSRGKLVNKYDFYDVKATSHGYSYITGWLNIDFIEEFEQDVIGTSRQFLNWELEETRDLKEYLTQIIKDFYNSHKEWRKEHKKEEIKKETGIDVDQWITNLPKHEGKLAKKITDSILSSEGITYKKAGELVKFTRDSFQFEAFKELASELEESNLENTDKIIDLFREWEIIEAKELYKIAQVRIETIIKFQRLISANAKEVPEIHSFLKQFSWILDPRIMNFEDEVTYSDLLRKEFKEGDLDEKDRRIDFLCQDFAESLFIIELKRPKTIIGAKELDQALDYVSFMRKKIGNENTKNVYCYIIGNRLAGTDKVQMTAESLRNNKLVYFKPYEELLKLAKNYHQEFINRYEEMTSARYLR